MQKKGYINMSQELGELKSVALSLIHMDEEFNCRGKIAPIDVVDLAKDIEANGLIQPVTIAPYSEEDATKTGFTYRLVAGYRRFMSHIVLKRLEIPAIIRSDMMDETVARFFNLSENIKRKDLNIVQEAKAIRRLKNLGVSEIATAERLGMSRGWVQIRYMLLDLPQEIQDECAAGFITQTNIRELFAINRTAGKEFCFEAARKLKDAKISGRKAMSVDPNATKPSSKRHRRRSEIFEVLDYIQTQMGNHIGTRCLAWCAGEISNEELHKSLEDYAEKNDLDYTNPIKSENKVSTV